MKQLWKKFMAGAAAGLMLLMAGCGNEPSGQKAQTELCVMAAASLTDAMNELGAKYEASHPDTKLVFSFGSSGALQTQIEEGAPADVFVSAAKKQMEALDGKGLILEGSKRDLLINRVVLIANKESALNITKLEDITGDSVKKIALGDMKSVPVGQYSEEIFKNLNILDKVKEKAVYASDVRQVLAWTESGEADCGIVYATDAAISKAVKVLLEAPEGSHKKVVYPVGVIKASKHQDAAKSFAEYLATDEGAAVFTKYGFKMSE
jgi:molybdate transport system substrate-binding protein